MEINKANIEQSPILVTGAARSGTSMIAGVINICGAFGGMTHGPNKFNAKGMFENAAIMSQIDKPFLQEIGVDPKGQKPLPDTSNLKIPTDWKARVDKIMLEEGYQGGQWFFKSARSCLVWPVWHFAYPNAKWVIVRRRSADVATSCLNTAFMNAYTEYDEWIKWLNHHESCFVEMIQAGLNVKQIWPERLIKGNYEQLYEVVEWLGLNWKPDEVMKFIEPKLWKARKKMQIIRP